MIRSDKNMCLKRLAAGMAVTSIFLISAVTALPAGQVASGANDAPTEDPGVSPKELDKKIDTAIKVLEVIREAMKDIDLTPTQAPAQGADEASAREGWINNMRKNARAISRIWNRTRNITGVPPETPEEKAAAEATRKDLSEQLEATIQAMTAIREELDSPREASDQK
jgi:septation ring formation regulator EzrA